FFFAFFHSRLSSYLYLHSFPTRRSSDLVFASGYNRLFSSRRLRFLGVAQGCPASRAACCGVTTDRSHAKCISFTAFSWVSQPFRSEEQRLNSSHDQISYAVFCLKKKKKN